MPVVALGRRLPAVRPRAAPPAEPLYPAAAGRARPRRSLRDTLLALLGSPNLASRLPLFQQYDWLVQSRTVRRPEQADAAVLALENGRGIATSIDGNGRKVACDPYNGTVGVVFECAANLACVGAEPLGTTNNLNFGNPEKPHIAWQLTEAVRGIADACRALDAPIVGGNVSLYNEGASAGRSTRRRSSAWSASCPTPRRPAAWASRATATPGAWPGWNRMPVAAGVGAGQAARRAAARRAARDRPGPLPHGARRDPRGRPRRRAELLPRRRRGRLPRRAGRGLPWPAGAARRWRHPRQGGVDDALLFGEEPCGFIVSGPREALDRLAERIPLDVFGTVGGDALVVDDEAGLRWTLDELRTARASLAPLFP
jgi:phosphoribosylformylglycinamidine synthase